MNLPVVSVIIPTHNRRELLRRALDALAGQSYPRRLLQVIVVADSCNDGTPEMLRQIKTPYQLIALEQADAAAAAARNRGADHASGEVLIFLDDDVIAGEKLVEAHVRAHLNRAGEVVLGYLPAVVENGGGYFQAELRSWWEDMFARMREPGQRFTYRDLLSGNFSIRAENFRKYGGFDAHLQCHEDYELGARALAAGARFVFVPEAFGSHHERTDLERSLQRKFQEGLADVAIGRRYPALRQTLLMARLEKFALLPSRALQALAFHWPAFGDLVLRWLRLLLRLLESLRLYGLWRRALYGMLAYPYWRGVAAELKSLSAMRGFLKDVPQAPVLPVEIDLSDGLKAAEARLDEQRPEALRLLYKGRKVACFPPEAGAERLNSGLLRPLLATRYAIPLLKAMVEAGDAGIPEMKGQILANLERIAKETRLPESVLDAPPEIALEAQIERH